MPCFQSLQCLYEYIFVTAQLDTPFGLFTMYPRRLLNIEQKVCDDNMVYSVEEGDNLIDLLELNVSECWLFISCPCVIRNIVEQYWCKPNSVHFTHLKVYSHSNNIFKSPHCYMFLCIQ